MHFLPALATNVDHATILFTGGEVVRANDAATGAELVTLDTFGFPPGAPLMMNIALMADGTMLYTVGVHFDENYEPVRSTITVWFTPPAAMR